MNTEPMKPIAEILDEIAAYTALADKFPSRFSMHAKQDLPKLVEALRHALAALDSIPCAYLPQEHMSTIFETPREIQAILSNP